MYRPKGWKKLESKTCPDYFLVPGGEPMPMAVANAIYEAGADAMLEGLKKEGEALKGQQGIISMWDEPRYGYLVFIPEGE